MNRLPLFPLFFLFLFICLPAQGLSGFLPVALLDCESVTTQEMSARKCHSQALQVDKHRHNDLSVESLEIIEGGTTPAAKPSSIHLSLRDFMQSDQPESRNQWLLLTVFAALILLAGRFAPSLK